MKVMRKAEDNLKGDFQIRLLTTILVIFGVVMIFSASYYYSISREGTPYMYLVKQSMHAVIGFIIMKVASDIDYRILRRFLFPIVFISLILLVLLFTPIGREIGGATRWIRIGPLSIMPGEMAKPALITFTAAWFAADKDNIRTLKGLIIPSGLTLLFCGLIIFQPNLSTAITILLIVVGMAFVAGLSWYFVGGAAALFIMGMGYVAKFGKVYQKKRLFSFMHPFEDATGDGFQVVQSLLAMGSGGPTGLGIGKSVQKTLYLPEPHTDFILAVIGEELGFGGVFLLMSVYIILVWKIFVVAAQAPDRFGMLFASGAAIMLGLQVALNFAIVTSSMPPTGVALPFISYGGNSLWIFMFMMGVVINISKQTEAKKAKTADRKLEGLK